MNVQELPSLNSFLHIRSANENENRIWYIWLIVINYFHHERADDFSKLNSTLGYHNKHTNEVNYGNYHLRYT